MNTEYKKITIGVLIFLVFGLTIFPETLFAASVYLNSNSKNVYPGDVFVVEARISSPDELINVVDGTLLFDRSKATVKELSTGGSAFTLWAEQPSFSNDNGTVRFIGGVPEGFDLENGLILKIVFSAVKEGNLDVSFSDGSSVFLSDGKGTRASLETKPVTIPIAKRPAQTPLKNEWRDIVGQDTTSPVFIESLISRDARLFDNQYFVNFFAVDEDSGIAYYEIREGDGSFIRAESPYILKDQSLQGSVQIKAIDKAGNEMAIIPERALAPTVSYAKYLVWLLIFFTACVLFLGVKWFLRTKVRGGRKK